MSGFRTTVPTLETEREKIKQLLHEQKAANADVNTNTVNKLEDKDGNVLYTDDLSMVPEEQRPGIDVVSEAADKAYSVPEDTKPQQAQTKTTETDDSEEIKERLEKQREALAKEAKALQEEIEGLKKEKEGIKPSFSLTALRG